ncbi:hypothetical protein [Planomonospora parontospora]|uniref:hypothetical protein n=1 Tax=Planomonospora parontospora TaxID=58119 RepID=UPI00166F8351|nr:hypothetical protein [Planomonospora parontospora]GGL56602.1 hypothetical protein GCM10014719_67530 [Planomonospora parontospora subsp. antibiotica]GII19943.1 hypothetical protein Ppa05_66690 [Planomonospora parontospora subsp. antibiotica]
MGTHTKTRTQTQQKTAVDWSLRPRGPVSATVQGSLALAALATVGDAVAVSPVVGGAATAIGAAAMVVAGAHRQLGPSALMYRVGCWVGGGAWWTWTLIDTPWTQGAWAALGIGAATAGILAPLGRATKPRRSAGGSVTPGTALVPRAHAALATEWEDRIRRCCNGLAVRIEQVEEWPTKTGYSLLVVLPPGGVTDARLKQACEGMANDARLPLGCGVEVLPPRAGQLRGTVWLEVATVDRLAADIDHPGDYSPRSVIDGITIGEYRNGQPMRLNMRQPRTIVVGTTGSAKTGTLHTITAELGRCFDNLPWHMDLNGGGVAQAWVRPWMDGEVDRPAIDWAASCPEEALLMADAQVRILLERKTAYAQLRVDSDTDLLPVSASVPQVTIILDEGAEVLAPDVRDPIERGIRDRIEKIARLGRADACQVVVSALRSISSTVSTDLLALLHNRIIMAGCAQKEVTYLYESANGADIMELSGPGSGFVRIHGNEEVRAWKAWRMKPQRDIRPASLAMSRNRTELDAPSVAAAGEAYRGRHERMRWCFSTPAQRARLPRPRPIELPGITDDRGNPVIWDPALTHPAEGQEGQGAMVASPRPTPSAPAAGQRPHLTALPGGATADASTWADPIELARRSRPQVAPVADASQWADPREMLRATQVRPAAPSTPAVPAVPAAPVAPVPEILRRALAVFESMRTERLHSEELAAALGLTMTELADLLRPLEVRPLPNKFSRGGQERRGYARAALETAAERITRGEIEVPADVAAWPAA